MMDLLCITTGKIFRLPDVDALRYYKDDPKTFKILDAGFQEEKEEVTVDEKTVAELIVETPEDEETNTEEEKEEVLKEEKKPIEEYSYAELQGLCMKLGLSGRGSKESLITRLKEELDKE